MTDMWKVLCISVDGPLPKGSPRPSGPTYLAPLQERALFAAQLSLPLHETVALSRPSLFPNCGLMYQLISLK